MSRLLMGIVFTTLIFTLGIGCSTNNNPIENLSDANPAIESSNGNHTVTGVYNARFNPDTMEFTVTPARDASYVHFDFTQYLDMCPDGCLRFLILGVRDNGWFDVGVLIENPTAITVFDVRLVFANPYGKQITDIDGFTVLWPSVGIYLKPFIAFAKQAPRRMVEGYLGVIELFSMQFVPGCRIDTLFITECSFDENIEEPYDIVSFGLTEGTLDPFGSSTAKMGCDVLDWQEDVDWVKADLSMFTGEVVDMTWNDESGIWECDISNDLMLPVGEYNIPIEAYSENVWSVSSYGWATVEVTGDPNARKFVYSKLFGMASYDVHSMFTDATRDVELTSYGVNTMANGVTADFSTIIYDSDYIQPGKSKGFRMDIDGLNKSCLLKPSAVSANRDGSSVLLYDSMSMKMWIYDTIAFDLYPLPQESVQECVMAADAPRIAFTSFSVIGTEIFTCDFYGENEMQVTTDSEFVMSKTGLSITDNGMRLAYSGTDADPLEDDLEIYTVDLGIPDSQVNITANELNDTAPQINGSGIILIVFVTEDHGAVNIMKWDPIDGVMPITDDSIDPSMVYANPDVSSDGLLVVFEKVTNLSLNTDIAVYDMTAPVPEPVQVTFDGVNHNPLVSAN